MILEYSHARACHIGLTFFGEASVQRSGRFRLLGARSAVVARHRLPTSCAMVFLATGAVNDPRPLRGALPSDRVIDSARRPEIAPPSDRRRGCRTTIGHLRTIPADRNKTQACAAAVQSSDKFFVRQQPPYRNSTATPAICASIIGASSRWRFCAAPTISRISIANKNAHAADQSEAAQAREECHERLGIRPSA